MYRYRALDPAKIVATLDQLKRRIGERFPGASLAQVCQELETIANESRARAVRLERPNYGLRMATALIGVLGLAAIVYVGSIIEVKRDAESLFGVLQGIDAAMNILIVMGAAAFFLSSLESRWKRQQAMAGLHELRSIVHVIDMHQLTKDPSSILAGSVATPSSPKRTMTAFELVRYLDYCSEMLSLTAKVAALYAQSSRDAIVIDVVNDIERLTANLSQKVWQKIMILNAQELDRGWPEGAVAPARGGLDTMTAPTTAANTATSIAARLTQPGPSST